MTGILWRIQQQQQRRLRRRQQKIKTAESILLLTSSIVPCLFCHSANHSLSVFLSICSIFSLSFSLCVSYLSLSLPMLSICSISLNESLFSDSVCLLIILFHFSRYLCDSPISFSLEPSFCLSLCLLSSFSLKASLVFACFFQAVLCLMHLSCFFLSTSDSPNLSLYRAVHSYFCDLSISLSFSLSLL